MNDRACERCHRLGKTCLWLSADTEEAQRVSSPSSTPPWTLAPLEEPLGASSQRLMPLPGFREVCEAAETLGFFSQRSVVG